MACRALAQRPDPAAVRLLLDGTHLVTEAHEAGLTFEFAAIDETALAGQAPEGRLARQLVSAGVDVLAVTPAVLAAMSPVRTPSGMVAIVHRTAATLDGICARPDAFVLALTGVQDPGNVGALLRVAEAGGVTGAVVAGGSANPAGWKTVRGSMGSALRLPVSTVADTAAAFARMRDAGLRLIAAAPRDGVAPEAIDWRGPAALWLGGEGAGLDADLLRTCDALVTIPMTPPVESLNVAVAGGILVYAAGRTRR